MAEIQDMIDAAKTKVRGYLQEVYPDFVEFDEGTFTVQEGSAIISISIRPWYENDIAVEFTSELVSGATISPELMRWLLETNVDLHFGALGLLFDDTIVYSQTLPGGTMDKASFQATVRTVAAIADHYDDEIIAMGGGTPGSESGKQGVSE